MYNMKCEKSSILEIEYFENIVNNIGLIDFGCNFQIEVPSRQQYFGRKQSSMHFKFQNLISARYPSHT